MEHFEDDDDNDNDSDDVEDVSVHGWWITVRYARGQAYNRRGFVACDFRLPSRPAVPRVILNDLCERIGDMVEKELRFRHFRCLVREASAKRSQNQRFGFQIEIKENKAPGDEHCLDPPGAELLAWSKN